MSNAYFYSRKYFKQSRTLPDSIADVVYEINEFFSDLKPDKESTELKFFDLDNLPENIMPTQIGYIERFVSEKRK